MRSLSDIRPETIEIDVVREGRARILVHSDIREVQIAGDGGKARTVYEYDEDVVWMTAADPKAAIETHTAGLVTATTKGINGPTPVARDTLTGLPGKVQPTATDPVLEPDAHVRARREQGYRILPMPRRPPKLPPAPPQPPAQPVGDVIRRA